MTLVIAARGIPSEKNVDGQNRMVVPFIGADRRGEYSQVGVGLLLMDEHKINLWWSLCGSSAMLIQAWRGMKILGRIERVDDDTLCACWFVARHDVPDGDKRDFDHHFARHFDYLAERVGGVTALQALRDEVLVSVPSADELDTMVMVLREEGVYANAWELEEELGAGRIETTPLIETIIREADERRAETDRKHKEVRRPLPPEESLGILFRELGIGRLFYSSVDMDSETWIEPDELDQWAKEICVWGIRASYPLKGMKEGGKELEHPWYAASDGTKYVFVSASYRDGCFYVETAVEGKAVAPVEGEYTIAELRDLIGPLPPKPTPRRGL